MSERTLDLPGLGTATYNAPFRVWYLPPWRNADGEARNAVGFTFDPPDCDPGPGELKPLAAYLAWIRDNEPALRRHVAEEMFPEYLNGSISERPDAPATPEAFAEVITLADVSVTVGDELSATLDYADGGLMGGHMLVLTIDARGRATGAVDMWG